MAPFYGWGSTISRLEPLRGGSLLFTTKFPKIPGTHISTSEGWTAESTLEPPNGFEHRTPGLGIQRLNIKAPWRIGKFHKFGMYELTPLFYRVIKYFILDP